MKVAMLGTWHVHAASMQKSVNKDPRAELVAIWDGFRKREQPLLRGAWR